MKTRPIAHSSDKDLPLETAHLSTSSSTAPAGWKLVPAEPTWEMIDAFFANPRARDESWKEAYRDMLAAAPPPPTTEQSSAVQQPQVQQEPSLVAKIIGMDEYGPMLLWHRAWTDFPVGTKIYTRPQPRREPLTDEQRRQIWRDSLFRGNGGQIDWFIEGTRAAELAHGITGDE